LGIFESLDSLQLAERSEHIGRLFESTTRDWKRRFPLLGDIRGVGAMRALELVKDPATRAPADSETARILAACHSRGLLIISAGTFGNVIRILVPLVATDAQIEEGLSVLEEAIAEVSG